MKVAAFVIGVVAVAWVEGEAGACTNFLVTKGASADGSAMITYAADSHELYGELALTRAGKHLAGETREVFEWDTGKHLGKIPQVAETYAVLGNINEHQVAIGETTFTGRKELQDPKGGIDYGSLMFIALERSRTAREAIGVMARLVEEFGYFSEGENFSISDPNEVWMMVIIGKGEGNTGAVWVAGRVPEDHVSAHANGARIRTFPLDDPENWQHSKDVITFAREKGYFAGKDEEFSFADAYAPLKWEDARVCEARVWAFFSRVSPSRDFGVDFVNGDEPADVTLPLWIKPEKKLSVRDVMGLMRDHFEGTPLDLSKGIGAGPYGLPYRWRPLEWEVDGVKYMNDRSTSTQQTGFSFVTQSRAALPGPIGGVLWFGVDDTASTVYVPMYCGIDEVPWEFRHGNGDFQHFTWESAFWVFNFVSNWTYTRYQDIIKDVRVVQSELEGTFAQQQPEVEKAALALYKQAPDLARRHLTEYSALQSKRTLDRWRRLGTDLFMKYMDGNVRNEKNEIVFPASQPGYPEAWRRTIKEENPDLYRIRKLQGEPEAPPTH